MDSTAIVIAGATGDLTRRKLLPALFNLSCKKRLPPGLKIVGFARSEYSDDQFRDLMWESSKEFAELAAQEEQWEGFASTIYSTCGLVRRWPRRLQRSSSSSNIRPTSCSRRTPTAG